jgi:hypothetical protein
LNGDGKVNIIDIQRVAKLFGKTDFECKKACSSYNNEKDCLDGYCKWCKKCDGYKVNRWKEDKCVDLDTDCGYECGDKFTPHECGAGSCLLNMEWNTWFCECYPVRD